jgi:hypothetical protein
MIEPSLNFIQTWHAPPLRTENNKSCHNGFATLPSFNKGVVNRNATLAKVIRVRNAEIERRVAVSERPP